MALDIGQTRVGVAISDPAEQVATPLAVVDAREVLSASGAFKRLLEDWEPELFVCGMPYTLRGEEGPQATHIKASARTITEKTGIPHVFTDERLSSREAKRSLREKGMSERDMRGKVDMIAAGLFLQTWLDSHRA